MNEKDNIRKRIYEIIEASKEGDIWSKVYDVFMLICIIASILPLTIKGTGRWMITVDYITTYIFIVDYILRIATADFKLKGRRHAFAIYPVTPMAIVDMLSILPVFIAPLSNSFRLLKIFRLLKVLRYSKSYVSIVNVFKKQKKALYTVCLLSVVYIFASALVAFNVEPYTFGSFFDAIYWATISLTTIGYGDICAVSVPGKLITMISAVFGIAIVAFPAGIITIGYRDELSAEKDKATRDIMRLREELSFLEGEKEMLQGELNELVDETHITRTEE